MPGAGHLVRGRLRLDPAWEQPLPAPRRRGVPAPVGGLLLLRPGGPRREAPAGDHHRPLPGGGRDPARPALRRGPPGPLPGGGVRQGEPLRGHGAGEAGAVRQRGHRGDPQRRRLPPHQRPRHRRMPVLRGVGQRGLRLCGPLSRPAGGL